MTDNRIDNYYYQSISLEEEFFDFKKQIVSYSYDNYYKIIKNEVSNLNRL